MALPLKGTTKGYLGSSAGQGGDAWREPGPMAALRLLLEPRNRAVETGLPEVQGVCFKRKAGNGSHAGLPRCRLRPRCGQHKSPVSVQGSQMHTELFVIKHGLQSQVGLGLTHCSLGIRTKLDSAQAAAFGPGLERTTMAQLAGTRSPTSLPAPPLLFSCSLLGS